MRDSIGYVARDNLQTLVADIFKDKDKKQQNPVDSSSSNSQMCVKTLMMLMLMMVLVSAITSIAVVSTYCAFFMNHGVASHSGGGNTAQPLIQHF